MGGAILRGCLAGGEIRPEQVYVTDPDQDKLKKLREELGISPCGDIRELTRKADLIFVGVKPGSFDQVLPEMADELRPASEAGGLGQVDAEAVPAALPPWPSVT